MRLTKRLKQFQVAQHHFSPIFNWFSKLCSRLISMSHFRKKNVKKERGAASILFFFIIQNGVQSVVRCQSYAWTYCNPICARLPWRTSVFFKKPFTLILVLPFGYIEFSFFLNQRLNCSSDVASHFVAECCNRWVWVWVWVCCALSPSRLEQLRLVYVESVWERCTCNASHLRCLPSNHVVSCLVCILGCGLFGVALRRP